MRSVLFIVGPPGVGKTTLVRAVLGMPLAFIEKPKWTLAVGMCAAGHYKGETFDGADRVPYNGVDEALKYWEKELQDRRVTIFDGDRFSYPKVVERLCKATDVSPKCVILRASNAALTERRAQRGSNQNESWMKGRVTKSEKFFTAFAGAASISLNAEKPTKTMAAELLEFLAD